MGRFSHQGIDPDKRSMIVSSMNNRTHWSYQDDEQ